jgi:ERCC4-type nuclease
MTDTFDPTIIIDTRERPVRDGTYIGSYLHPKDRIVRAALPFGDIAFNGHGPDKSVLKIGVERKTLSDLLNSIRSDRLLGHQLPGMANTYDVCYLFIEGIWKEGESDHITKSGDLMKLRHFTRDKHWETTRYKFSAFIGMLHSIEQLGGFNIWHARGLRECGRMLSSLYGWWQRPWNDHKALRVFKPQQLGSNASVFAGDPSPTAKVAMVIPGVGYDRALALADVFPNPSDLMLASGDELQTIPGIGAATARSIQEFIRGRETLRVENIPDAL